MSTLRYSVTVQFDVDAGDTVTLDERLSALEDIGTVVQIKAKSAGKKVQKDEENAG